MSDAQKPDKRTTTIYIDEELWKEVRLEALEDKSNNFSRITEEALRAWLQNRKSGAAAKSR